MKSVIYNVAKDTQRGFALVSAIFLLVILTALGAFMLNFSTVQHTTSTQDLQGTHAYQAARAGMEWGVYRALRTAAPNNCLGNQTLPALAGSLAGFNVVVDCNATPFTEGVTTVTVYRITATATIGAPGTTYHVSRQLRATVSN